jgi:hypothetical protein
MVRLRSLRQVTPIRGHGAELSGIIRELQRSGADPAENKPTYNQNIRL